MNVSPHSVTLDIKTASLLAAVFNRPQIAAGERLPPCWHWAMIPPLVDSRDLGNDGHPADLLPDPSVRGWKRMWGGSKLQWFGDLILGHQLTYERAVVSFEEKEGRSGKIAICAVRHKWSKVYGDPVLDELQSIVYLPPTSTSTTVPSDPSNQELAREGDVHLTPVDLFRYSAVTFNSHRIHYDLRYATEVEGYPALVVHGPFLAMVLAGWAEQTREAKLSEFNFRNVNPLFLGQGFGYFMHGNNYEIRSARETCVKATASFREG